MSALSALSGADDFAIGVRAQTSTGDQADTGFGLLAYVILFLNFVTIFGWSFVLRDGRLKLKVILVSGMALAFSFATFARTGLFVLVLSVFFFLLYITELTLSKSELCFCSAIAFICVTSLAPREGDGPRYVIFRERVFIV